MVPEVSFGGTWAVLDRSYFSQTRFAPQRSSFSDTWPFILRSCFGGTGLTAATLPRKPQLLDSLRVFSQVSHSYTTVNPQYVVGMTFYLLIYGIAVSLLMQYLNEKNLKFSGNWGYQRIDQTTRR
jgi:hypothetical protein